MRSGTERTLRAKRHRTIDASGKCQTDPANARTDVIQLTQSSRRSRHSIPCANGPSRGSTVGGVGFGSGRRADRTGAGARRSIRKCRSAIRIVCSGRARVMPTTRAKHSKAKSVSMIRLCRSRTSVVNRARHPRNPSQRSRDKSEILKRPRDASRVPTRQSSKPRRHRVVILIMESRETPGQR